MLGMLSKVSSMTSGGMQGDPSKERFEAKAEFKLFPAGSTSPKLASTVSGKTGVGFDLRSALSLASTAGSFAMMSRGFMGFNPQMMNLFMPKGGAGLLGSPLGHLDPSMGMMMSMMQRVNAGAASAQTLQTTPGENEAMGDSLHNIAKAVATGMKKSK